MYPHTPQRKEKTEEKKGSAFITPSYYIFLIFRMNNHLHKGYTTQTGGRNTQRLQQKYYLFHHVQQNRIILRFHCVFLPVSQIISRDNDRSNEDLSSREEKQQSPWQPPKRRPP